MRRQDVDFMSELEAARHMRPAAAAKFLLWAIVALIVSFIIWAKVTEVEELVRGSGQVQPSKNMQIVQSLEGGILEDLLVQNGDRVEKGQILMRISDTQFASEERGTEARFASLSMKKQRLVAESQGRSFSMPANLKRKYPQMADHETELYNSRQKERANALEILAKEKEAATAKLKEAQAQQTRHQENARLIRDELKITREMVKQRAVPKIEETRLERELNDASGAAKAAAENIKSLEAQIVTVQKRIEDYDDKFRTQTLGELSEVESQITGLEESLKSIGDRVDRTELRAPVSGIVNGIALTTIGGVVEPAMKLVEIVPVDDDLKIVAKISPNDIAFLKTEMDVKVKISAYDPQRYGALKGKITRVGATSSNDKDGNIFFEIEVETEKNYLGTEQHKLLITSGMIADVEVITGKRTILQYLAKPFLKAKDVAFTER